MLNSDLIYRIDEQSADNNVVNIQFLYSGPYANIFLTYTILLIHDRSISQINGTKHFLFN